MIVNYNIASDPARCYRCEVLSRDIDFMTEQSVSAFVAAVKEQMRLGNVTANTEHHLRREFSQLGWDRDHSFHAAKVDLEIGRLEKEAETLRTLRKAWFGEPATTGPSPAP